MPFGFIVLCEPVWIAAAITNLWPEYIILKVVKFLKLPKSLQGPAYEFSVGVAELQE